MNKHVCPLAFVLPLLLAGCKPDAAVRKGEVVGAGPNALKSDPAPDAAHTGNLTGVVNFAGPAPARVLIDMSQDPACAFSPTPNLSEQLIVDHGKLANVFVYVKNAPNVKTDTPPVLMDQKGCRFIPHVLAVPVGATVQFRNDDPTMHNVHTTSVETGNHTVDLSQAPGAKPDSVTFTAAENMLPVRCNNHPWMNAFINVSPNPYFAVTAADGTFSIPNLPIGTWTVALIHEKLGEQDLQITIKPLATTPLTATFKAK